MVKNKRLTLLISMLLLLAIIVVINLIFNKLSISVDLTQNELYKVSDEARGITAKLDKPIDVYCFVQDEDKPSVIGEFTKNFCKTSNMLNYHTLNPSSHPEVTKKYASNNKEITINTVVFDDGDNYRVVSYANMLSYNYLTGKRNLLVAEERFCLAVMSLGRGTSTKVALLSGHGESVDEGLQGQLDSLDVEYDSVDIRNGDILNYDMLMLISPQIDFTASELELLDTYLANGGTILAVIDASIPYHEMLEGFLAEWGVKVERNMVLGTDAKSIMGNQPYSLIGQLKSHAITDGLIKNHISPVFFATRSITPIWEVQNGVRVSVLAESSDDASAISVDDSEERGSGTFPLLTLSEGENGRIFTFGSNMFFNEELKVYNQDLLRNIITYSTDGTLVSDVSPKVVDSASINVPQSSIVIYILIFGISIPILIAVVGIIVAIRRKRL